MRVTRLSSHSHHTPKFPLPPPISPKLLLPPPISLPWRPPLVASGSVRTVGRCVSLAVDLPNTLLPIGEVFVSGNFATTPAVSTTPVWTVCSVLHQVQLVSNPLKGDRVAQMESFFHLDRFQLPHPQGLRTIGPRLYRAPDLKSRNSCIQRHLSQTTLSTIFSTSGPLRLLLTVPLHQYSTTVTFTRRSMRSDLDTYPGVHILSNTTVSALKTHPSRNG